MFQETQKNRASIPKTTYRSIEDLPLWRKIPEKSNISTEKPNGEPSSWKYARF